MYCRCISSKHGFTAMRDIAEDGSLVYYYEFWVCSNCLLPTRMVFEKLTGNYAPRGATSIVSVIGRTTGVMMLTWRVQSGKVQTMNFHPYPYLRINDVDQGRNHLLTLWQKLDNSIDIIRSGVSADMESQKARALTLAEVIAQLMNPFYADTDAVLRESMARWKARQAGVEHDTPGLAEHNWDPPRHKVTETASSKAVVSKTPKATGNRVPDSAIETVKQGIQMGMFTVKQMADTYKMSDTELKEQLGLA